jgi:hypothetical protein
MCSWSVTKRSSVCFSVYLIFIIIIFFVFILLIEGGADPFFLGFFCLRNRYVASVVFSSSSSSFFVAVVSCLEFMNGGRLFPFPRDCLIFRGLTDSWCLVVIAALGVKWMMALTSVFFFFRKRLTNVVLNWGISTREGVVPLFSLVDVLLICASLHCLCQGFAFTQYS